MLESTTQAVSTDDFELATPGHKDQQGRDDSKSTPEPQSALLRRRRRLSGNVDVDRKAHVQVASNVADLASPLDTSTSVDNGHCNSCLKPDVREQLSVRVFKVALLHDGDLDVPSSPKRP